MENAWRRRAGGWAFIAALGLLSSADLRAEDMIRTADRVLKGTVVATGTNGVSIDIPGEGVLTYPRSAIVEIQVEQPGSIKAGILAYEAGNPNEARLSLGKLVEKFKALDTGWARTGIVYYGRTCLAAGDYDKAAGTFNDFLAWYPEDDLENDARLGLANVALAQKRYEEALEKFQAIAGEFEKELKVAGRQLSVAAETWVGIGKSLEGLDKPGEAIEAYLRVVALYPAETRTPEALYAAGKLFLKQNNPEQARIRFEKIADYRASPFAKKAEEELKALGPAPAPKSKDAGSKAE